MSTVCKSILNQTAGVPHSKGPPPSKVRFASNFGLLYGNNIASQPAYMNLKYDSKDISSFVPWIDSISLDVYVHDFLGSLVRISDFVCRSWVCSPESAKCSDITSLLPPSFFSLSNTGSCAVELSQVVCAIQADAVRVVVTLVLLDAVDQVASTYNCLPCQNGQSRKVDYEKGIWWCLTCSSNQYIIDPNNVSYSCQDCPVGAVCNGSSLHGLISESLWTADKESGRYILMSCPLGYELHTASKESLFSFIGQSCVKSSASRINILSALTPKMKTSIFARIALLMLFVMALFYRVPCPGLFGKSICNLVFMC